MLCMSELTWITW